MTELIRSFAIGDSVISTTAVLAPPTEPHGVRLEIPAGIRGTVVDVRDYEYPRPYTVIFDVADGSFVEADVTDAQIVRVAPPVPLLPVPEEAGLPPLEASAPHRHISRQAVYAPTVTRPHHRCAMLHWINGLLMFGIYLYVLRYYTVLTLVMTGMAFLVIYGQHLQVHRSWAWKPELLRVERPSATEHIVTDAKFVRLSPYFDLLFSLAMACLLAYRVHHGVSHTQGEAVLYVALSAASLITWGAKTVIHDRAARIYPKYND